MSLVLWLNHWSSAGPWTYASLPWKKNSLFTTDFTGKKTGELGTPTAMRTLTTGEIISHSSNIGVYKIAKRMGRESLYQVYRDFGVGNRYFDLGIKHQGYGRISSWEKWKNIRFANISFGQGLMMSGLEVIQAFGAIANGGQIMKPILIQRVENDAGEVSFANSPEVLSRSITIKTARKMRKPYVR